MAKGFQSTSLDPNTELKAATIKIRKSKQRKRCLPKDLYSYGRTGTESKGEFKKNS